ncbi:SMC5-SMC6 complex localization factor protein 2 isoform X2 [Phyllopteryx taeniolatus]|uniref:SMC5-SMC6 complex localization factor protein 2 isoform X2 n=1 Tax=Phyllopteryx taeniolatus TaxID=161469 RepID=UPI002AD31BF2|nr:SMC5-SMC6 complex localization factor protein 2 isoform X2 [Phyllopteryx taeniolatus]
MKIGAENKGDSRTPKITEHYSPWINETPMKPSQIANCLVAPPRRMLPFPSPDSCQRYISSSPYQPSYRPTSVRSSESHHQEHRKSLSGLRPQPVQRPQPPVTVTTVANKHDGSKVCRPSVSQVESPHPRKHFSARSLSAHIGRQHKSVAASDSGRHASLQRLASTKECLQTPPIEKAIPAVSLDHSSQKRHRESKDRDGSVKKLCLRVEPPNRPQKSPLSKSPVAQPNVSNERSPGFDPSSTSKPAQSSYTPSKPAVTRQPFLGAKQLQIHSSDGEIIQLRSPANRNGEVFKKTSEGCNKNEKANAVAHLKNSNSSHFSHCPRDPQHSSSESSVRTPIRKSRSVPHEAPNCSLSIPLAKRNKMHHRRRTIGIPNDYDKSFSPYIVLSPVDKTDKTKPDRETDKRPPGCSFTTIQSSENTCSKREDSQYAKVHTLLKDCHVSLPNVSFLRLKMENTISLCSIGSRPKSKDCPVPTLRSHSTDESLKRDEENKAVLTERPSNSPLIKRREGHTHPTHKADSMDEDLDLGLDIALEVDSSQTSNSSEEEQLLSWQEIMNHVPNSPATPDKATTFSEPSTTGCSSNAYKVPTITRRGCYKNSLDQMLKERDTQKRARENEAQLRTSCDEELLKVAEYHEEENRDKASSEQQEFLQRYSLESSAVREVPPGEVVFHLDKFGHIFSQDSLQLRRCAVKPQTTLQKTLLWSSPAQLRHHVNIGLFQEAYSCHMPCPTQVTDFLFKMMSVNSERILSEKILQALCDIAKSAAYNIVKKRSQVFNVWMPALADLTLVLMNMGVTFVTLFPFEHLQPAFTEGDLLKNVILQSECPSFNKEWSTFPEHNCNNIFKYLTYCMRMCPAVYSDYELLLLLTVMARVALDAHFIPLPGVEINILLCNIVENIRDWDTMLPRICQALTDLTDDHHNMCHLVQLLPNNTLGKCLRQHLSLSMISKLLDGTCRYRPTGREFKLAALRPYVPTMQPASLRRFILNTSNRNSTQDDVALDQQSYYLCYSLLTLTNTSSEFTLFPTHQKEHLLNLCSDLRTHVIGHIRESEKWLYRSKVKDLLARIYTNWQMTLHRIQPLNSQLCDYWKPSSVGTLLHSQQESDGCRGGRTGRENAEEEVEGGGGEGLA